MIAGAVIPTSGVVAANVMIVFKLRQRSANVSKAELDVAISLIVVSTVFFLCQFSSAYITNSIVLLGGKNAGLTDLYNYLKVNLQISESRTMRTQNVRRFL